MLGWVIKRGLDGGRDAPEDPDDTRIEQPDTPGPVFAARAFKSALFGTPARPDDTEVGSQLAAADNGKAAPMLTIREPTLPTISEAQDSKTDRGAKNTGATPRRLPGILLTPGTATSRRKRVSFGNEVVPGDGGFEKKNEFRIDRSGRRPNLFGDNTRSQSSRTTLARALENARKQGHKTSKPAAVSKPDGEKTLEVHAGAAADSNEGEDDNLWEEVDDDERDPDITVDLNEPHSQSGRYWKSEFQRYQEDAKVEMSKLLKYKQLAKSYAKMKDAEAIDMHTKLQEEKDKVTQMEGRITELAGKIACKRMEGSDRDYQELISDLTRQTARAVQYRNQVKELEALLQDNEKPASAVTTITSPRTQRTLIDTQRELRRARDQAKELTQARDEVRRLKSAVRAAEQRALKNESNTEGKTLAAKMQDLEKRAQFAEDERRQKDKELRLLQRKYDSLKDDAKARVGEAEQVMRRKNEEIAELKKQVRQATAAARLSYREALLPVKDVRDIKDNDTAGAAAAEAATAKLALLRRRRGAEPLRPNIDPPQPKTVLGSIGANHGHAAADSKDKPKADLLAARLARMGSTMAPKVAVAAAVPAERDDPVAAAAAAAADASRLSISSERAAAAVARIEKRRAERKRDLNLMLNKENMQPA